MRDRESQRLHHQEGIVAAWGSACFTHYGWGALPLPLLRQLHDLAVLMPRWADAVDLLNAKMLARHELRVVRGNNKALRVGEHSAASKVQHPHSPVERSDIVAALEWAESETGAAASSSSAEARRDMSKAARFIGDLPIGQFGLSLDAFGMVVPSSLSGDDDYADSQSGGGDTVVVDNEDEDEDDDEENDEDDGHNDDDSVDDDTQYSDDPRLFARPAKRTRVSPVNHEPHPVSRNTTSGRIRDGRDSNPRIRSSPGSRFPRRKESEQLREVQAEPRDQNARDKSSCQIDDKDVVSEADRQARDVANLIPSEPEQALLQQEMAGPEERIAESMNLNSGIDGIKAGSSHRDEHNRNAEDADQRKAGYVRRGEADGDEAPRSHFTVQQINPPASESHSAGGQNQRARLSKFKGSTSHTKSPVFLGDGSPSRSPSTLLHDLQSRHGIAIHQLVEDLSRSHVSDDIMHQQRRLQLEWLGQQRWARIYAEPEHRLGRSCVASSEDADVWYLSWEVFRNYAEDGYIFRRPVVIKQEFPDSGEYDIADYVDSLWQRFPEQHIDVQNSITGESSSISVSQYCLAVTEVDLNSPDAAAAISSATNLGRLARADEPLLRRLPRFRLLSTLADRIASAIGRGGPLIDVQGYLGFNLLCFTGAFSGSYVDPLLGSWVRCLSGVQITAVATDLDDEDWRRFSQQGRRWSPRRQGGLLIALEQDDVLFMPPGLRIVRATFAPSPCLVEGGMLWDEYNIPEILEGLLWVVNNTNHAYTDDSQVAFQLSPLIDELERWVDDENYVGRPSRQTTAPEHDQAVIKAGIRALRASLRLPP